MEQCEFCGANLPANAGFCGRCGRTPRRGSQQATSIADASTLFGANDISRLPTMGLENLSAEQRKEEERRRRAALLGFGVPLLGELAGQRPLGQVPAVQGTPQIQQIVSLQGTPQLQRPEMASGHVFDSGSPAGPGGGLPPSNPFQPGPISHFPVSPPYPPSGLTLGDADFPGPKHGGSNSPGSGSGSPGPKSGSSGGSGKPKGSPSGCLVGIIVLVVCILLILGSIVGLGLTVWAPSLALSGSASVAPGGTLALHGSGFLPNSSVTLILDTNIPIYVERNAPSQLANKYIQVADSAQQMFLQASNGHSNILSVRGDGTFAVSFQIDLSWSPGRHTIHASEAPTHRSAALSFTILQGNSTVTPSPTQSITPPPGVTPTATVTSTTPPSLSCASPANLALGPVSEYSSQTASNSITLCTSGTGTLTWNASWNAVWLSLSQNSGSIQAPNQAQITATAAAANMAAGNYSTTITFTNTQDKTTQAVTVSFTVQVGCVNATPPRMVFSGVANMSDPAGSQTITATNCGLTSSWSAKVRNGSKWLSINPNGGTLNGGATGKITVSASNLKVGLSAGSYTDFIDITIGSKTSSVTVVLSVQAQPMIVPNPTTLDAYAQCTFDSINGGEDCPVTLSNSSSSLSLTWTWSASTSGVTVNAPNGMTIGAGGSEGITIVFITPCNGVSVTVSFTGPGPNNTATVTYTCRPIP